MQWLNASGTGWNGVPQPVSGVPTPKVVAPQPGDATPSPMMVHTVFCGQLILRKIVTIVATRDQILRRKCTKFYFGLGSEGGKEREGKGKGRRRKEKVGVWNGRGRERTGRNLTTVYMCRLS